LLHRVTPTLVTPLCFDVSNSYELIYVRRGNQRAWMGHRWPGIRRMELCIQCQWE